MNLVDLVRYANLTRNKSSINLRLLKMTEEMGEISEVFLNLVSGYNGKDKSWADMREETVDVLILALDIALTLIDQENLYSLQPNVLSEYSKQNFETMFFSLHNAIGTAYAVNKTNENMENAFALIVQRAFALVYMPMPDQSGISFVEHHANVETEMIRKLAKWAAKRAKMAVDNDYV